MKRAAINWEQVHGRLQATNAGLDEAFAMSPQRIENAYRQRAIRLAKSGPEHPRLAPDLPAMIVWLARERYAIELKYVAEALPLSRYTPVPGAPPEILGVINVRGELRPVLDLGAVLGLPRSGSGDTGFVLMLRHEGQAIGLRVDGIDELREIPTEGLARPVQGNYLKGLVSGTLMLLDTDAMLADVLSKEES